MNVFIKIQRRINMVDFLMASCPIALWIITAVNLAFTALLLTKFRQSKNKIYLLSCLLTIGLFYDAAILALGTVMKEGALLLALSRLRYVFHGGLIPLIYALCAYALDAKGIWLKLAWVLTGVLSVLGIADGCIRTLGVQVVAGVTRYASVYAPAWAEIVNSLLTFGTVIPLMIVGIIVWVKQRTPRLFLAGFFMFAFSCLGAACLELMFYISMYGEVLMAAFFYLYAVKKDQKA